MNKEKELEAEIEELSAKEKRFKFLVENIEKCREELKKMSKELKGERF